MVCGFFVLQHGPAQEKREGYAHDSSFCSIWAPSEALLYADEIRSERHRSDPRLNVSLEWGEGIQSPRRRAHVTLRGLLKGAALGRPSLCICLQRFSRYVIVAVRLFRPVRRNRPERGHKALLAVFPPPLVEDAED